MKAFRDIVFFWISALKCKLWRCGQKQIFDKEIRYLGLIYNLCGHKWSFSLLEYCLNLDTTF
jgi:hypothetical protein